LTSVVVVVVVVVAAVAVVVVAAVAVVVVARGVESIGVEVSLLKEIRLRAVSVSSVILSQSI